MIFAYTIKIVYAARTFYTTLSYKVKFQIIYCHKKFETITTRRKISRGFRIFIIN